MAQVARMAHATRCDRSAIQMVVGVLLLGGLVFGGCGAQSTTARTPAATPTATPNLKGAETPGTPVPTPTLPYTFPTAWRAPSGGPAGVTGFAFAPSAPQIGYACSGISSGQPGTPTPPTSGPALDVTHDGGATWQALRTGPFAQGDGCYRPFVDDSDAQDVFVAIGAPWTPNPNQDTFALWRSRDGGQTWTKHGSPDANDPIMLDNLIVVGGRIIVSVFRDGAGTLPYYLLGSDDGGATWTPLGQSLLSQKDALGQPVYAFGSVIDAGSRLYSSIGLNCSGGCIEVTPAPGQAKPGEYRSTDRGTTWQPVSLPYGIDTFIRTPSGAYYGLAVQFSATSNGVTTLYWSRDGGAIWTALPTMANVEGGYLDPASIGAGGLTIAPDGTVIAGAMHQYAPNQSMPTGLFYLHATDPEPAWRPLAPPGVGNLGLQAVATPTGARLWGIQDYAPLGQHLVYVDIP